MTSDLNHSRVHLSFVLGGARSGKSDLAFQLAGDALPRAFVATGEARDEEMATRIQNHQRDRGDSWKTVEVPVDVAGWFKSHGENFKTVIVDCLTLWLSNLLEQGVNFSTLPSLTDALLDSIQTVSGRVVIVSNELGLGIVPGDQYSRRFRDLAGRLNQQIAKAADEVYLSVSGLPLKLK